MPKPNGAIEYQERDVELLRDLFVSRIMTLAHAAALHFEGRKEAAKKRVQKLKAAQLISERPRKAREPSILCLARRGFELLGENGSISAYPHLSWSQCERRSAVSDLTLRHELAVMDAKAALAPAIIRTSGMTLIEFSTWPILHQFDVRLPYPFRSTIARIKPDGLIRVEEARDGATYEHTLFLEVDRGTETLDTITRRALGYREHYASGGHAESRGAAKSNFADYPFRVIVVVPSEERRNNFGASLLAVDPPIETQVWITTVADVVSNPLGSIWIRPRDYREAIVGTAFGAREPRRGGAYRREPQREAHVQQNISRRALFSD